MTLKDIATLGTILILATASFSNYVETRLLREDIENQITVETYRKLSENRQRQKLTYRQDHTTRKVEKIAEYLAASAMRWDLDSMRTMVLNTSAEIRALYASGDELRLSLAIRNFVHHNVANDGVPEDAEGPAPNFHESWTYGLRLFEQWHYATHGSSSFSCQGFAFINQLAHESFGIPTRTIDMFAVMDSGQVQSHVSLEVLIGGEWIASDSTYNISYVAGDRYLNYEEVRRMCKTGITATLTSEGYAIHPALQPQFNSYYPSCEHNPKIFDFLVMNPAVIHDGVVERIIPAKSLPEEWDREIDFGDGHTWHATYGIDQRSEEDPDGDYNYRSRVTKGYLR